MSELRDAVERLGYVSMLHTEEGSRPYEVRVRLEHWPAILDLVEAADRQLTRPQAHEAEDYGRAKHRVMALAGKE